MDASSLSLATDNAEATRGLQRIVRSAWRLLLSIRVAECVLVGASAGALTWAAGILSAAAEQTLDLRLAAGLGGLCAAWSWWLERRPDIASVVRRIDRREGWSGELVTAFEVGRDKRPRDSVTEVERTLARRVVARLSLTRCLRATAPSSAALLALPFASAAVLFLALDAAGDRLLPAGSRAATSAQGIAGIEAAISSLASAARSLRSAAARTDAAAGAEPARELLALAGAADDLVRDLGSKSHTARAVDALTAQTARLRDLAARARLDPSSALDVEQAERALVAARQDLSRDRSSGPAATPGARDGALPPNPSATPASGASPSSGAGPTSPDFGSSSSPALAGDPASRASVHVGDLGGVGSTDAADTGDRTSASSTPAAGPGPATGERGTNGGRWWAQRYDGVVERWVEALREDRNDRPRSR